MKNNLELFFCLQLAFTLVSYSAYSWTLKMEAIYSSETSVDFQRTIRRYITEDSTLGTSRSCHHFYNFRSTRKITTTRGRYRILNMSS
jgi:hypothetical protein